MAKSAAGRGSRPPRIRTTKALPLFSAVVALATVTACSQRPVRTDASDATGGALTVGMATDVGGLDPQPAANGGTWRILNVNYETLVGLDPQMKPTPKLATAWRQTSPTTYVFDIRPGVKFSNGRAMTVDDVVGSMKRLIAPKLASLWAGVVGPISDVRAVGTSQVLITLEKPRSSFISSLANIPAAILPMKELDAGTFDPTKQVLGTGPYKVAAHRTNESWSMVRNPYYWGPPAKAKTLTFKIMPDDAARIAALRSGSVQITTFEAPDAQRLLKGQPNITTVVQKTTEYYELFLNALSSVFRDDRLRQAVALSIDRNKILSVAMGGVGQTTSVITPLGMEGSCNSAATPLSTPDLTKARQLVTAAGAQGKSVSILASTNNQSNKQIAQVLQENLQAIGLKVNVETIEIGQLVKRVTSAKVDFDLDINNFAGYNDPSLVTTWWNPRLAQFNKGFMKSDARLNKLIDQGFATPPGPARAAVLQQACDRAAEGANMIPLVTKPNVIAYRSDKVNASFAQIDGLAQPLIDVPGFGIK
jgi:peptide/nickel transport system substrate-binding protein